MRQHLYQKTMKAIRIALFMAFSISLFSSCQCNREPEASAAEETRIPKIVCTTGMIGDALKNIMGDNAEIDVLMGPGVDPHLYKATQGDVKKLSNADIIVYNGLHLEGKMGALFENLEGQKPIFRMSDFVDEDRLINSTDYENAHDPHIWFDVNLWSQAVKGIAIELESEYPAIAESIEKNEKVYSDKLYDLEEICLSYISEIPEKQKVMITAHDAFKYFGKAYNIEVQGLQGISTAAEYGLKDVSDLVTYITDKKIKAIFVESSVSKRSIEAVIEGCKERGHEVVLGGELFSDAMGEAGTPEGTYYGMVNHNVETIVKALK